MNRVITDKTLYEQLVEGEQRRLADFDNKVVGDRFRKLMGDFIAGKR
jgi:hypothetical protein